MKRSMRTTALLGGMLLAFSGVAVPTQAAVIVANYTFSGGSTASSDTDPTSSAGNVARGSGLPGGGFSSSTSTAFARSIDTAADPATAISGNSYFTFTLTPTPGPVNLSALTFDTLYNLAGGTTGAGPQANYFVRSSLDGFTTDIGPTFTESVQNNVGSGTATNRFVDLSGPAFQGLTSPITFNIYIYDNSTSNDLTPRLDNIVLTPEPTSTVVAAVGIGLAALRRRRRRR